LKRQQETEKQETAQTPKHVVCDKQYSSTQPEQKSTDIFETFESSEKQHDNSADQEELDAIANINNFTKLNDECLPKNDVFTEKKVNERKRKPSEDKSFCISTQRKFDKLEIKKTPNDIPKAQNENKEESQLKNSDKVCASDSKLSSFTPHNTSGLIIESKEKVSLNSNSI